ncbi:Ig-like domain-containing protein, partial [Pseudomonas rhodesiae]
PLEVLSAYDINSLEANNGLANKTVLRTWLAALPNNQEITISCAVTFDGSTDQTKAVSFPGTTYTIRATVAPLTINTNQMSLTGTLYLAAASLGWPKLAYEISQTRTAQGGTPPYTYSSSAPSVATVGASNGRVVAVRRGTTTITVRDSSNPAQTASYSVNNQVISYQILHNTSLLTMEQCRSWIASVGGAYIYAEQIGPLIGQQYGSPHSEAYFTGISRYQGTVLLAEVLHSFAAPINWTVGTANTFDPRPSVCLRAI